MYTLLLAHGRLPCYCISMKHRLTSMLAQGLAIALLASLASCVTSPETGRRSLQFMPESQLQAMAADQFAAMREEIKVSDDAALHARIATIGRRVAAASGSTVPPDDWEFVVFEHEAINAFAMPGGKVGFFTGLIELAGSDDEIAAVMGHEVAHVTLRHGNERVSQALAVTAAAIGTQVAVKDQDRHVQQAVMLAIGLGSQLGILLPYSRVHEREADRIGLLYAARAGYDPRAAVTFWERVESEGNGKQPPEFLSTHPSHGTRIRDLNRMMPDAMAEYARARNGQR